MKRHKVIFVGIFVLLVIIYGNIRIVEIWTKEDLTLIQDEEISLTTEGTSDLVVTVPYEAEKIVCDKCGKIIGFNVGLSIRNLEGVPDINYCQDCFIKAMIWLVENYDKDEK